LPAIQLVGIMMHFIYVITITQELKQMPYTIVRVWAPH
jgi:hypothetical protein